MLDSRVLDPPGALTGRFRLPQGVLLSRVESGRSALRADAVLIVVTLIAAAGWLFSYHALRGLPPLLFIGLRFLAAALTLGAFGGRRLYALRSDRMLLQQGARTGVLLCGAMMCWIMGLHFTTAMGAGAFISSLGVVIAPIMARLLFRVRIPHSTWAAIVVATFGMACLALRKGMTVQLADLFFFASALCFSIQFTLNSRFAGRYPVLPLTAIQLAVVGLVALAASALSEEWPAQVDAETWVWFATSVLIATSLRYYFQIWAQGRTTMNHAAFIMTLEPVWTALLAGVWLGERMRPVQLLGCALVFCALLIGRVDALRRPSLPA